jgi:hypothetical protein
VSAELAARRTAAAAVLADFQKAAHDYVAGTLTSEADWLTWAYP